MLRPPTAGTTDASSPSFGLHLLSLGHRLLLLLRGPNEMTDKIMMRLLVVLIPFSLWLALPRYIEHLTTYPDTATPEDLLNRPPALTETPSTVGNR